VYEQINLLLLFLTNWKCNVLQLMHSNLWSIWFKLKRSFCFWKILYSQFNAHYWLKPLFHY